AVGGTRRGGRLRSGFFLRSRPRLVPVSSDAQTHGAPHGVEGRLSEGTVLAAQSLAGRAWRPEVFTGATVRSVRFRRKRRKHPAASSPTPPGGLPAPLPARTGHPILRRRRSPRQTLAPWPSSIAPTRHAPTATCPPKASKLLS